jgi:hypothetical protein
MPTKPDLTFIPRDIREDSQLSEILDYFSNLIDETVNFGSNAIIWCINSIKKGTEFIPVFLAYRHMFELLDAISILVRESCIDPCKIILRSIFEALLSVEYILEKDIKQRATDFLVWSRHQDIKIYRRYNPKDQLYKNFDAILKKDKHFKNWKRLEIPNIEEQINTLSEIFQIEPYSDSEAEYQRLKKKNGSPKWWFNLHGGPKDIQDLSTYLGRPAQYEILYRQWSAIAHSIDILKGKILIDDKSDVASFIQIRLPTDAQFISIFAVGFAVTTTQIFINFFAKEKIQTFKQWYENEIRDKYIDLTKKNKIIVI